MAARTSRSHPNQPARLGRRALVLGASMAGQLTARVLSEYFDDVCLLERDTLPQGAEPRKGTPHAGHAHALLARGANVIETLFPGLSDALVEEGALSGDVGQGVCFNVGRRRLARAPANLRGLIVSRLKLEAEIRRRVLALPNVRVWSGVDVLSLTMSEDGHDVTGVRLVERDEQGQAMAEQTVSADFVVDATGRGSRMPQWLTSLGFEPAPEERVGVAVQYATAYFERQGDEELGDTRAVICSATPEQPAGGVLIAQEPDDQGRARWVMSLGSMAKNQLRPTVEGMREHARLLGCPEITQILHHAKPIGEVSRYQFPHSQRRHYEHLRRFPARLAVIGDALASFNPIYGQGMSAAAGAAMALRDTLAQGLHAQAYRQFFKAAAEIIDIPWNTAVGTDLAFDFVPGKRTPAVRISNAYVRMLHIAAQHDAKLTNAFLRVGHLVAKPSSLLTPGIVARVLWGCLRGDPRPDDSSPVAPVKRLAG